MRGALAAGALALEGERAREVLFAAALAEGGSQRALREAAAAHRARAALARAGTDVAAAAAALAGRRPPRGAKMAPIDPSTIAAEEERAAEGLEAEAAELSAAKERAAAAEAARLNTERAAAAAAASAAARERLAGASGTVAMAAGLAAAAADCDACAEAAADALARGAALPLVLEAHDAGALALAAVLPLGVGALVARGDAPAARRAALAHGRVHAEFAEGAAAGDAAVADLLRPWAELQAAGGGALTLRGENPAGEVAAAVWTRAPAAAAAAIAALGLA